MPRPLLIRSKCLAYHVRSRANNKEWFYLSKEETWALMCGLMKKTIERYCPLIHSFVLMDNHFHLILTTPKGNLDAVMQYFIRECSKNIGRRAGRMNRIFGGRYQRSLISNEHYFRNALKYNFRNPVAAGICTKAEEYPYSTLPWTLGVREARFELSEEPAYLFRALPPKDGLTTWLANSYSTKQAELIRRGLRRKIFQWPKDSKFRRVVNELGKM